MYKKYFGLIDHPFRNTPDEEFFYSGSERGGIVDGILFGIMRGDAIISVVGEVGSGKTTLIRVIANKLKKFGYEVVYIPNPNFSSDDILHFIASELGLSYSEKDTKFSLYNKISSKLLEVFKSKKRVAVIIDEAHLIPLSTLEEIRLLSNIETEKEKLLSIVLVGQPELKRILSRKEARQLKSRISHEFCLEPFSKKDVHEYLNFRMIKAGYDGEPVFSKKVSSRIYKHSNGLPRLINNLADQILLKLYADNRRIASVGDLSVKSSGLGYKKLYYFLALFVSSGAVLAFFVLGGMDNERAFLHDQNLNGTGPLISSSTEHHTVLTSKVGFDNPIKNEKERKSGNTEVLNSYDVVEKKWGANSYAIGVLTTPCSDKMTISKVINSLPVDKHSVLIVKYQGKVTEWCKIYIGRYETFDEAKKVLVELPEFVKNNSPFIMEVYKLESLLEKRNAHVYFAKK